MTKKKDFVYEIRIRLQSYNQVSLKVIEKKIKQFSTNNNIKYSSISLPIRKRKITLLKSPHVNKKARDQLELLILNRLVILKGYLSFADCSKFQRMVCDDVSMKLIVSTY